MCWCPQLRHSVRSFLEKELVPYADDIDKQNTFPQMRVSRLKYIHDGVLVYIHVQRT